MNKASGSDEIPAELFLILKYDAVKVLHSICQQTLKTAEATGLEKVSFHSNLTEEQAIPKNVQTTVQLHLFCILVMFCSKSFKVGSSSM